VHGANTGSNAANKNNPPRKAVMSVRTESLRAITEAFYPAHPAKSNTPLAGIIGASHFALDSGTEKEKKYTP